jgi:hypothetical protein
LRAEQRRRSSVAGRSTPPGAADAGRSPRSPDNVVDLRPVSRHFCRALPALPPIDAMSQTEYLLELLDSEEHHAVQTWPLDPAVEVTIGRARTNAIVLPSPLVSRAHARLVLLDGCWVVEAQSELGLWNRGALRSRLALADGSVFRLGEHGPALRLAAAAPRQAFDAESTLRVSATSLGFLHLDTARRDREVAEIAGSDFFRSLEQRAGNLRSKTRGDDA